MSERHRGQVEDVSHVVGTDPRERRLHSRIHVSTPIEVAGAEGIVEAELRDLSHGGARFTSQRRIGREGDQIELFLPGPGGEEIGISAAIVRLFERGEQREVAVRFVMVEPSKERALHDLIETLLEGDGGGKRRHPRVARRLNVECKTTAQLVSVLEDISRGGAGIAVDAPLQLDEPILVIIPDSHGEDLLTLPGRVMNNRKVNDDPPRFVVGVAFDALSPERRRLLDMLLRGLCGRPQP
jgi:c-di-GMP-binding flagellar brake protein YcgR